MTTRDTPLILVVDDAPDILDMLKLALTDEGYRVKTAIDGRDALVVARHPDTPDLIILDVLMPHRNGWETAADLRAGVSTRHIPLIFLTAVAGVEDERRGHLEFGAADYLTKPFELPHLLMTIEVALRRAGHGLRAGPTEGTGEAGRA